MGEHKWKPNNGIEPGIHYAKTKLKKYIERLGSLPNGERAIAFLHHLQASGISTIRVVRYANCLAKLLPAIDVQNTGRNEIEPYVAELNGRSGYKAWTKHAYKLTVKKLFKCLKYCRSARFAGNFEQRDYLGTCPQTVLALARCEV